MGIRTYGRTVIAGIAGGITMYLAMFLTFTIVGGVSQEGGGLILGASMQSQKLVAVYTDLEPLPRIFTDPLVMLGGVVGFGVVYAGVYRSVAPAWPEGVGSRSVRFAGVLFGIGFAFWEFWTPFNLFGEPLALISLELSLWAVVALAAATAIVVVSESGPFREPHRSEG